MTILPLAQPVNFFGEALTVFEVTATRVDGRQQSTAGADRNIFGVVQPNNDKEVKLEGAGALSHGEFLLHTWDVVYIYDYTLDTSQTMQTYLKYGGETWKLDKTQNWSGHVAGKTKRYLLTKYTNIDGIGNE